MHGASGADPSSAIGEVIDLSIHQDVQTLLFAGPHSIWFSDPGYMKSWARALRRFNIIPDGSACMERTVSTHVTVYSPVDKMITECGLFDPETLQDPVILEQFLDTMTSNIVEPYESTCVNGWQCCNTSVTCKDRVTYILASARGDKQAGRNRLLMHSTHEKSVMYALVNPHDEKVDG